jgi:integrase
MAWKLELAASVLSSSRLDAWALPWEALEPAHVAAMAARLAAPGARPDGGGPYAARTINATLAAVRGVLTECWRGGTLERERLARLTDLRPEPVTSEPAGRALAAGELAALFDAAAADPCRMRGLRDAAALALLYGGGLRAAEACAVHLADLDLAAGLVTVRRGKGRKVRTVPLAAGAAAYLAAWIRTASLTDGAGPVLLTIRPGRLGIAGEFERRRRGPAIGGGLSPRALARIAARLAEAARVPAWRPHDLRRSWIGDLLTRGADLATVQAMAGHADPATTARYDRRPAETRAAAARLLALPVSR